MLDVAIALWYRPPLLDVSAMLEVGIGYIVTASLL